MKKQLLFILAFAISVVSNAQTGVIAQKSHSGQLNELDPQGDNFGDPPMDFPKNLPVFPDTMTYLGNKCVQIKSIYSCDTLCNDEFFDAHHYNPDELKKELSPGTVFINFEKYAKETRQKPSKSNRSNKGSLWLFVFISFSTLSLFLRKKYKIQNA